MGLSGEAVDRYVDDWIVDLTDVTASVHTMHGLLRAGDGLTARALLPHERPYLLPQELATTVGASPA
jgi:hypothetical protein